LGDQWSEVENLVTSKGVDLKNPGYYRKKKREYTPILKIKKETSKLNWLKETSHFNFSASGGERYNRFLDALRGRLREKRKGE